MNELSESALSLANEELESLYDGASEGILVVDAETRRFVRANRAICELLGYSQEELMTLSVDDIHPTDSLAKVHETFEAMRERHLKCVLNIPCLRKDGRIIHAEITASHLPQMPSLMIGFFRDVTEQNRTVELLRASKDRYRLIADNVDDLIWTSPIVLSESEKALARVDVAAVIDAVLDRWRFSFVSPAAERVYGYAASEIAGLSLRDITTSASYAHIRETMIVEFLDTAFTAEGGPPQYVMEAEFRAKDGSLRWCEVVSAYLRDDEGMPTSILGITRDISARRKAEKALRESESKLRNLFENLPDLVVTIDRDAKVHFVNRGTQDMGRESMVGVCGFTLLAPEHQEPCRQLLGQAFATGEPRSAQLQDIFGQWWSIRAVPLANDGDSEHAMVICTNITQERLATELVNKERRLLRQLLELHERERRLMAYEIHDGFAQQLAGALFRLQGFREMHSRNPAASWEDLDAAVRLVSRAIDETRRLISGLRPPILDESGIIEAIDYLVYEHGSRDGPQIEFVHNVAFDRLAPPLESALFRIVQESLQNACRHSRSERIRVELSQTNGQIHLDVRDWGVGFSPEAVEEQRFGLQGIRERVRLLDGSVVIESAPDKGTLISIQLPLVDGTGATVESS